MPRRSTRIANLRLPSLSPRAETTGRQRTAGSPPGRALLSAYPSSAVVAVSHVSPIKLILQDALAGGPGFLHRLYLDPAGASTVDYWPDGGVAVRTVNDTSHLR